MSRQLNFFAHPLDLSIIRTTLSKTLGSYSVTPRVRGPRELLVPTVGEIPNECSLLRDQWLNDGTILIVPNWASSMLLPMPTKRVDGEFMLFTDDNPVVEYRCSVFDPQAKVAHRGRFYWSFKGSLQAEQEKMVDQLFRLLRESSARYQRSFLRIFPHAKDLARAFVENEGTQPVSSPFTSKKQE